MFIKLLSFQKVQLITYDGVHPVSVDAEFVSGQRGTQVLLDPLKNRMSKKKNDGKLALY